MQLPDEFIEFFTEKIAKIQVDIDKNLTTDDRDCLYYQSEIPKYEFATTSFRDLCETEVESLVKKSTVASCDLGPIPTWVLKHCHTASLKIMTQIINKSLQSADMPKEFKLAILIPLLKKIGLEVIKPNLRPVSNLFLIESAVASQFVEHMTNNELFEPLQSAYRQGHSTETALLKVQNDMLVAIDSHQVSILLLLDLSAAFDTVNHDVLLKRLKERCGVQRKALKWFESYLTDRFQMVKSKEITSKRVALHCGLPQGSVLGPLLFLVYTLPLGDFIKSKGLQFHLYADDTQIYMSFTPNSSGVANSLERIEQCIQEVSSWMSANRFKLNGDKTKMLVVGTPQQCLKVSNLTLNVADSIIESSETVKNLGAIFDKHMNLKAHVNAIVKQPGTICIISVWLEST